MIARQRTNLNRTFAHNDESSLEPETARRLADAENALMELTAEFTQGMEERFGPIPTLNEAFLAMKTATEHLRGRDARSAVPAEEAALAALIKSKRNLRKLLGDGQSASQCRSFDRSMQQKLRTPPKKKDESPKQSAQDLRALAQRQRKLADDLKPQPQPGLSQSQSKEQSPPAPSSSPSQGKPQSSPAERQETAAREAERLKEALAKDPAVSELARQRMGDAAGTMRRAADDLKSGRDREAADRAGDAAGKLERLAEQVEGLKAADLAAKLAAAKALAQGLARQEADLATRAAREGDGQAAGARRRAEAGEQRGLAEGARTLDDWLGRFRTDAADESRELGESLRKAGAANPPREAAEAMDRAAEALAAGRVAEAGRDAGRAAGQLDALARDLDDARRAFVQPKLDQLLAAERQAARARDAVNSARDAADKARAEKALAELVKAVDALKPGASGNRPLAAAAANLADGVRNPRGGWGGPSRDPARPDGAPAWVPPGAYTRGLQDVITALQSTIQEMILKDALQARDEPVPPRYRSMVEEYYRVLSEDLR